MNDNDKNVLYLRIHYRDFMSHGSTANNWSVDKGYQKGIRFDTYPRRALSIGFHSRFTILLRAYQQDLDYVCKGPIQGYKIILHSPADPPRLGLHFFRAPHMQEVTAVIKPDMVTSSHHIKAYRPQIRQCYFPDERRLSFFQIYSQQNCEIECLTNFTISECGCVAPYMPREERTPICGSGSILCIFVARRKLLKREIDLNIEKEESGDSTPVGCDCLPGCNSIVYNTETSQADLNYDKFAESNRMDTTISPGIRITRITLFFKESQFIAAERTELYGRANFFANFGGLLGLYFGFSCLTFFEIIYFLSLRIVCNVKRYGRHYWSGSSELINGIYHHTK